MIYKKVLLYFVLIIGVFNLLSGCATIRTKPWTAKELRSELVGNSFIGTEMSASQYTKGGGTVGLECF